MNVRNTVNSESFLGCVIQNRVKSLLDLLNLQSLTVVRGVDQVLSWTT